MILKYISHACVQLSNKGKSILFDPWILDEPVYNFSTWKFPENIVDPYKLSKEVDAIFITHTHEDHFHVPSLNLFDRNIKIYIPEYTTKPCLRAHTAERTLRLMGFGNIEKVYPWTKLKIFDDMYITAIPCAETRMHDWENCGVMIETSDVKILNMNDNVSDDKLCMEIKSRWPKIDVGLIQSVGVTMYPGCFKMTNEEMIKESENKKISLDEQRRLVDIITPDLVVPFAGDFCWLDDQYFHNNWASRGTPKIFVDFMKEEYPHKNCKYAIMLSGDTWSKNNGVKNINPGVDWDNYLDEIKKLKNKNIKKIEKIRNWIKSSNQHDVRSRTERRLLQISRNISKNHIDFSAKVKYLIEDEDLNFTISVNKSEKFQYFINSNIEVDQTIYIPKEIWCSILDGKLTFNIIQWVSKTLQHVPYRKDIGKFHFWLEYHIDLETKCPQVYLDDKILPSWVKPVDLNRGVFL